MSPVDDELFEHVDGTDRVARRMPSQLSPSLWRDRDFVTLWAGQGVSEVGSQVTQIAVPVLAVLTLEASPLQVGLLAACGSVAYTVGALPAGAWVDRARKRPVMIGTDIARAVLLASLPAAQFLGQLTLVHLYLVAVAGPAMQLLFRTASHAHLPALVQPGQLLEANAKLDGVSWAALIGGPALGGVLISVIGPARTLLVDSVSFLVSAATIGRLRRPEPRSQPRTRQALRAELTAGMRYLWRHRLLRRMMIGNTLMSWKIAFTTPVEILFLLRELAATPLQYGLAFGMPGAGGLLGVLCVRRLVTRFGPHRVMWYSGLVRGPWVLLVPAAQPGWVGLAMVTAGWTGLLAAAAIYNTAQNTYRQQVVPPDLRGRVFTSWSWLVRLGQPLTPVLGGAAATTIGLRPTLVLGAVVLCLSSLLVDRTGGARQHSSLQGRPGRPD